MKVKTNYIILGVIIILVITLYLFIFQYSVLDFDCMNPYGKELCEDNDLEFSHIRDGKIHCRASEVSLVMEYYITEEMKLNCKVKIKDIIWKDVTEN